MSRIADSEAFDVLDIVETDYSGKLTRHIISARFKVKSGQTGVAYEVVPKVRGSNSGAAPARLDHAWFKRVGRLVMHDDGPEMVRASGR